MIYYDIQHHGDTQHLDWLTKRLSDNGSNFIHISLDQDYQSVMDFKEKVNSSPSNINVSKSIPISWCGPSQMAQQMNMLNIALKKSNWEYFINLSGSCYPLKSQFNIKAKLQDYKKKGINSFCYGFVPKKAPFWFLKKTVEPENYSKLKYLRLQLTCDHEVSNSFLDNEFDPVRKVMHRRGVHCTENPVNNEIVLRGLYQHELESRQRFWNENPYTVGRAWVILSRKQVEWIVSSDFTYELYSQLSQTFEPDETFFSSVLFNDKNPYKNELLNNNYRYNMGAPGVINNDTLIKSFNTEAFFSRKINYSESNKKLILDFISKN